MIEILMRRAGVLGVLLALLVAAGGPGSGRAEGAPPAGYELLNGARYGAPLRLGAAGDAVEVLQRALTAAGYPVPVTRLFDVATWTVVRRFQRDTGCAVDGVVGAETLRALDRVLGVGGTASPPGPSAAAGAPAIPPRPAGAATGSAFLAATRPLDRVRREAAILDEVLRGNVPEFERAFLPVTVSGPGGDGLTHRVIFRVLPDYLAIGSDDDFVRIPMNPLTAQRIADAFGCSLPTRRMVDEVWRQAGVRLAPIPLPPGPQMMSNGYFATHQRRVEAQRAGRPLGPLTAGHKKDVVISNLLRARPGRVAIYGWHEPNGRPIQPLSTVHENTYADYSHGIRLVAATVDVDGAQMPLADLLRSPSLSRFASDEGPMPSPRIPGVPAPPH